MPFISAEFWWLTQNLGTERKGGGVICCWHWGCQQWLVSYMESLRATLLATAANLPVLCHGWVNDCRCQSSSTPLLLLLPSFPLSRIWVYILTDARHLGYSSPQGSAWRKLKTLYHIAVASNNNNVVILSKSIISSLRAWTIPVQVALVKLGQQLWAGIGRESCKKNVVISWLSEPFSLPPKFQFSVLGTGRVKTQKHSWKESSTQSVQQGP